MKWKTSGIILFSFSLLVLGSIIITGNVPFGGINDHTTEKTLRENTSSDTKDLAGVQTIKAQALTDSRVAGLKFSGEVLTCTNKTDLEQIIDLRLSNLDKDNLSIDIYPLSTTIEILKGQIIRKDLNLPYGISSLKLVSNKREELFLQVPPCLSRGGSSSYDGSQSSFSSPTDQFPRPPAPVPELSTIALTGVGMSGLIFIVRRSRQ
ncbi:MAG: hypothetical protein J5U19_06705 [Candidatus Methanoperedens sp.]|nr:hypothetical protein [Candidatus Methanoperedens sp.]